MKVSMRFHLGLISLVAVLVATSIALPGISRAQEQARTSSKTSSKAKSSTATASNRTAAKVVTAQSSEANGSLPSKAEVDTFMRHMFGYNLALTWKIIDIQPSEVPRVAHVIAVFGSNPTATHLYVLPGGNYAVVGEMIPFGVDPYAQIRAKLTKGRGESRGNAAAPVTIVEFSDLQCPYCKAAQPLIDRLLQEEPNTRLVFQPFPLPQHKWATKAASYAQCVDQQSAASFWKFVQGVYDAQESVTEANGDEKLTAIANNAGANGAKAAACSVKPDTFVRVQQSIELGKSVGVAGTPTVFINGRKVNAIKEVPFDNLKAMVNFEAQQNQNKDAK